MDCGEIIQIKEDTYFLKELYTKALSILKDYLADNESITASQYRDLLNTNRKIAIGLLEYFDQCKITKRIEDKRTLF